MSVNQFKAHILLQAELAPRLISPVKHLGATCTSVGLNCAELRALAERGC